MTRYFLSRLAQFVVVVAGALFIVFVALNIATDPSAAAIPVEATPEVRQAWRVEHGFDRPVYIQMLSFFANAARGNFGDSLWLGEPALRVALDRAPNTAMIAIPAVLLGCSLGLLLAMRAARRPKGWVARTMDVGSMTLLSVADFWVAIMLVLLFAVELRWLPTAGRSPFPYAFVLPILVLALRPSAQMYQIARSTMVDEYGKLYVLTAWGKGLDDGQVSRRHVLRNAAIPIITLALFDVSRIFAGSAVIVETIFAWGGLGQLAFEALIRGDVFLIEAVVAVSALTVATLNLGTDLLYFWLDPRTRSVVKGYAT